MCGKHCKKASYFCIGSLSIAWGLTAAIFTILLAWAGMLWGVGLPLIDLSASLYHGYAPTLIGGLWGGLWALIEGVLIGLVFGFLYNTIRCCCACKSCKGCAQCQSKECKCENPNRCGCEGNCKCASGECKCDSSCACGCNVAV